MAAAPVHKGAATFAAFPWVISQPRHDALLQQSAPADANRRTCFACRAHYLDRLGRHRLRKSLQLQTCPRREEKCPVTVAL